MPRAATIKDHDNLIIEDVEDARAVVQGSMDIMEWGYKRMSDETGYVKGAGLGVCPGTVQRFYEGVTQYPRFQTVVRMLKAIGFQLVTYKIN